ncbi:MAG: hypothetical protein P8N30_06155 [Tateyamaria sp.]|jgi:hypothetical protein|nr:hypothetical protein [Tateyamaria sp.]MDG1335075.1 hypothetical protein [Tateyamaria sp.]MDG2056439.1 hypothetical protein [Tateyamaria sp.]
MSVQIKIPANERGIMRVFALSMTDAQAETLRDDPAALSAALGAQVDADKVEVFAVSNLDGVGLVSYLSDGNAVSADQLAPDRAKLEKLGGWVCIVFSQAFRDQATALALSPALTLIGTYGEEGTDWRATQTITADAAKPFTAPPETVKKRPSDAAMSGRIATIALIVLGLLTWLMIWISG